MFSLVRHFYGVKSSAALLKEVIANRALEKTLPLVPEMIGNAFVDDLNGSYNSEVQGYQSQASKSFCLV